MTSMSAQLSLGVIIIVSKCEFNTSQWEMGLTMTACVTGEKLLDIKDKSKKGRELNKNVLYLMIQALFYLPIYGAILAISGAGVPFYCGVYLWPIFYKL